MEEVVPDDCENLSRSMDADFSDAEEVCDETRWGCCCCCCLDDVVEVVDARGTEGSGLDGAGKGLLGTCEAADDEANDDDRRCRPLLAVDDDAETLRET
jgi:hypothetical protein